MFKSYTPDVAKPLTEAVIESLREKGYIASAGPAAQADAILTLNLAAAGYGPAFESSAFVPQFLVVVTVIRAGDQQSLYREAFAYGGGFHGALTKLPHDQHLAFKTRDEVLSQPHIVAQRLVEAARLLGLRITAQLSK